MRVLLISPLRGLDPPNGDVTYTENLLQYPPEGVEYVTYDQALREGSLYERGVRHALMNAWRTRHRMLSELLVTSGSHAINRLRRWRWLFSEPFRFFEVCEGAFDLVHLHVFSARFLQLPCPLVVSNAAPLRSLYADAFHYSKTRTRVLEQCDRALGRAMGVNLNSYYLPQATRLMVMTEFLRNWYLERGIMPADRVDIVPIYLPSSVTERPSRVPRRVGFVAANFVMKGGLTLLRAFAGVRRQYPEAELWVVGSEPQLGEEEARARGITWLPRTPREKLLAEILPKFDVFAYPTEFDGQPLVILEAMAAGVPVATSDYQAVPELVDFGRAGLVSPVGDHEALAANILRLLDPEQNARFAAAGRKRFNEHYSVKAVRPMLRRTYDRALEQWQGRSSKAEVA